MFYLYGDVQTKFFVNLDIFSLFTVGVSKGNLAVRELILNSIPPDPDLFWGQSRLRICVMSKRGSGTLTNL